MCYHGTFDSHCILAFSFQSSSHPHGKRSNIVDGRPAILAILLSVCQSLVFWWYGTNYLSPYTRQWTAAWILCVVAACVGTIAMVVTFTATCRAYRQCGLKAICGLYILCFVCQLISLILAVTDNNLFCWADHWYSADPWADSSYRHVRGLEHASNKASCRAATLGFSISCLFLWGVCAICAALVPPYNANKEARVSPAAATVIDGSNATGATDEEEAK